MSEDKTTVHVQSVQENEEISGDGKSTLDFTAHLNVK